jgi:Protein of unknown function (DUF3891)
MVLYPLSVDENSSAHPKGGTSHLIPAWEAVDRKQKQAAEDWWLIAQPDHAALAGDIAANLRSPLMPSLDAQLLRAIALHDSGWARFDGGERGTGRDLEVSLCDPKVDPKGRPLSFLDMTPTEFLQAWTESIERAQQAGPLGGAVVSEHFCRLAENRLRSHSDVPEDKQKLREFTESEKQRQQHLLMHEGESAEQIGKLTDVLQFCDLFSLYLSCGAAENVEFPQKFDGRTVRLVREAEMCRLDPPVLGNGVSLGVTARRYPLFGAVEVTTLPFLLS